MPNSASSVDQPLRKHPYALAMTRSGSLALVTMRGSELEPGYELAVVDVPRRDVVDRVVVGARPVAVRIDPSESFAIVLSHLSPYASVVSLPGADLLGRIRVGYYAQDVAFSADGSRIFVTNRASDEVEAWTLSVSGTNVQAERVANTPAGENPNALTLGPDGSKLYVVGGIDVHVFDSQTLERLAIIPLNSPTFDLKVMGNWVVAATLNDTNGLPCADDGDYPGVDTDGVFDQITDRTCGRGFSDLQNEIAIIDPAADTVVVRYTSDSAQVSEADRDGDYNPTLMQVVGSLPFGIAVVNANRAYVSMGASFEVSEMTLSDDEVPALTMARTWDTDFAPRGIAVEENGRFVVTANMLGETISIIDTEEEDAARQRVDVAVGEQLPAFPATSAEIGELLFFTSKFSSDADQSCSHCHPDAENDGKAWGVATVRAYGRRATMSTRNLRDTQPLLIEGVFNENDFSLELEAMAFRPDFHDSSYAKQVTLRNDFFEKNSRELFGEAVDYIAMVHHLGKYLINEPRLLPSPFPKEGAAVDRGRVLYFQFETGCALCHPSPSFATSENFQGIITMARFDRPNRSFDPDTSVKFLELAEDGLFNANSLRGIWDRRGTLFHDGRARSIRETLLTPGHPCVRDGEIPFNEFNGVGDSHGGISHLSCEEIDDLVAFVLSLD